MHKRPLFLLTQGIVFQRGYTLPLPEEVAQRAAAIRDANKIDDPNADRLVVSDIVLMYSEDQPNFYQITALPIPGTAMFAAQKAMTVDVPESKVELVYSDVNSEEAKAWIREQRSLRLREEQEDAEEEEEEEQEEEEQEEEERQDEPGMPPPSAPTPPAPFIPQAPGLAEPLASPVVPVISPVAVVAPVAEEPAPPSPAPSQAPAPVAEAAPPAQLQSFEPVQVEQPFFFPELEVSLPEE